MKKYFIALLMCTLSTMALAAHPHHHGHHHGHDRGGSWVGPLLGGVLLGNVITNAMNQRNTPTVNMAPYYSSPGTVLYRYPSCRTDYIYNNVGVIVGTQSTCY